MSTKSAFHGFEGMKVYRNITRTRMVDEQILTELIPFAEKVFDPLPGYVTVPAIVVPDVSAIGNATPLIMGMCLTFEDQELVKEALLVQLRYFQEHFRVSRIATLQEVWTADPRDPCYVPGLLPHEQPNREDRYLLSLYRLGRKPLMASWTITTMEGKRILGEPTIQECESRFDINVTNMESQQESKGT